MNNWSQRSREQRQGCVWQLHVLFDRVLETVDCTWLEGYRHPYRQAQLFKEKKTKLLHGKHNIFPSEAADVVPYPVRWPKKPGFIKRLWLRPLKNWMKDYARLYAFAGFVQGTAVEMKRHGEIDCDIRSGFDWDGDWDLHDQTFDDLPHHEIREV